MPQDSDESPIPHGRRDPPHVFFKLLHGVLLLFEVWRPVKAKQSTEDIWVGAHSVVDPLSTLGLARGFPLRSKSQQ